MLLLGESLVSLLKGSLLKGSFGSLDKEVVDFWTWMVGYSPMVPELSMVLPLFSAFSE